MTQTTTYAFSNSAAAAQTQLAAIQGVPGPLTRRHSLELDLPRDGVCWAVGAGAGSLATCLAQALVPDGRVVATDIDTSRLADAQAANVDIHRADVATEPAPPGGPFDLIHARLVTQHLPSHRELLSRLVDALKPGGWLMLGEFDCTRPPRVICAPSQRDRELFDRFLRTLIGVLTARGVDMAWARQVHSTMSAAGLSQVHSATHTESWTGGGYGCRLYEANSIQLEGPLLAAGLNAADLTRIRELTQDHAFTVNSYTFVSTRGQRAPALRLVAPHDLAGGQ